jgi:hypothetical protein
VITWSLARTRAISRKAWSVRCSSIGTDAE